MITFVSLFLGLSLGTNTIGLTVSEPIVRVEIVVDGVKVAEVAGEPWSIEWDFGDRLVPHELVAVGYDVENNEVDRERQWLNLPRQPAETVIGMEGDPEGEHRTARLSWESVAGKQPTSIRVTFDQQPLEVTDPGAILLPPHDPTQLHFLRAELEFESDVTSNAEFVFGGDQLEQVSSELTAVPIEPLKSKKIPPLEKVDGWFEVPTGRPAVVAWEKGAADVVIVPALGSLEDLHRIRNMEMSKPLPSSTWRRSLLFGSQDWVLKIIWPISQRKVGIQAPFELFAHSGPLPSETGNVLRWVTEMELPAELEGSQRLADAVAVSGVTAAGKRGRRAVVLIIGEKETDSSRLSPNQTQEYLRSLRVPLHVWSTRPVGGSADSWGTSTDISSPEKLQKAMNQLFDSLDDQQVVWLAGFHLPQDIALSPRAQNIRLLQ